MAVTPHTGHGIQFGTTAERANEARPVTAMGLLPGGTVRMAADDPKFTCAACGKEYRWKPELAGRKAKCGCGAALVVPAERPAAKSMTETAPVVPPTSAGPAPVVASELTTPAANGSPDATASAGGSCPSCGASLAPNAVLCVNCGYNLKTGKTLSAVVVERDEDEDDDEAEAVATAPAKSGDASPSGKPAKPAKPGP